MLKDFSGYTYTPLTNKFMPPSIDAESIVDSGSVYKGYNIQPIISQLLIAEISKKTKRLFAYIPFDSPKVKSCVDSVIRQYQTDLNIVFMIDLINNPSSNQIYNLKVMKNIIPLALSDSCSYSFYYTYVDSIINGSYLTPYPYFITLSEGIIWINSDFDEILVINNKNVARNISSMCENKINNYQRLVDISPDVSSMVSALVENQGDITTHYCIEYEPCFSMHFTKEMIDDVVPSGVPGREQLISLLNIRSEQLHRINKSIQIFNINCLMEFAKTGVIQEFPKGYSRPCTKNERIYILEELKSYAKSNEHIIRGINSSNLFISDCLSLIIQDKAFVQFTIWNDAKMPLKYLALTEFSLCRYFYDFINDLIGTNYLFSKDMTIAYIQEAIDYLYSKKA